MNAEKIAAIYALSFQKETVQRSVDLLLAEMTSGIQYVSTREGVRMDRIQDTVPFVNESVHGEVRRLEQIDDDTFHVEIAVPAANLDPGLGGITNLWPVVAGEVFNLHFVKSAALLALELPRSYGDYYLGPRSGIAEVREFAEVSGGPLFGSIIKPNIGLDPPQSADVVRILAEAGFNFIKDDEICVNPSMCPLGERVSAITRVLEDYADRTGRRVLYAANVTSDFSVLGKAAETALKAGVECLMIDPFCTGLSAVDYLRRNFDAPIYAHRVGYGLSCLSPNLRIEFSVFTGLLRLLGADFSHVGGIWGKSEASRKKTAELLEILRKPASHAGTWPVVTGISLDNMADYSRFYGDDTLFMDHIDIYEDAGRSRRKLESLKERVASS